MSNKQNSDEADPSSKPISDPQKAVRRNQSRVVGKGQSQEPEGTEAGEREVQVLTPIAEREVDFYGDELVAALVQVTTNHSEVYVPIKPICDFLGLSWVGQSERIRRDEVLAEAFRLIRVNQLKTEGPGKRGNPQMLALPLKYLPGWLFGIDTRRIKSEHRDKLHRYRRECYDVLYQAFQSEALGAASVAAAAAASGGDVGGNALGLDEEAEAYLQQDLEQSFARPDPTAGELALLQIRDMGLSIARLAEQQLEVEREVERAHNRLDRARDFVVNLQRRLGETEGRLGQAETKLSQVESKLSIVEDRVNPPNDFVTEDQAATIANEVKALAELLTQNEAANIASSEGQRNKSRKPQNYYGAIFAELYRRFSVSTYRNVRLGQYATVLQFLADWKHAADNGVSNEVFLQGHLF